MPHRASWFQTTSVQPSTRYCSSGSCNSLSHVSLQSQRGLSYENDWQGVWAKYQRAYPELAAEFTRRLRCVDVDLFALFGSNVCTVVSCLRTGRPAFLASRPRILRRPLASTRRCASMPSPRSLLSSSADLRISTPRASPIWTAAPTSWLASTLDAISVRSIRANTIAMAKFIQASVSVSMLCALSLTVSLRMAVLASTSRTSLGDCLHSQTHFIV